MRMPEIVWESYHSDGRPRNTPLPSTVHGWLTKMRGTLLDNEAMRYRGIREMKQAALVRVHRQKEDSDRRVRDLARAKVGRSPMKSTAKKPWLPISFLRNRPKATSGRPVATARKHRSSTHMQRKPPSSSSSSRSRHSSTSGKRTSKRPPPSRKSSHASHASKRSTKK